MRRDRNRLVAAALGAVALACRPGARRLRRRGATPAPSSATSSSSASTALDYDLTAKLMAEGRLPNFSRLARESAPLQTLAHLGPAAEPGRLVELHHRHRRRRPRHLRLRPPRPEDDDALPVDQPRRRRSGRRRAVHARQVPDPARRRRDGAAAPRRRRSGRRSRRPASRPRHAHAGQLPAFGHAPRASSRAWARRTSSAPTAPSPSTPRSSCFDGSKISAAARWSRPGPRTASSSSELLGPDQPVHRGEDEGQGAASTVYLDPDEPVAKLVVGDEERILKVGEWSDWVPVRSISARAAS